MYNHGKSLLLHLSQPNPTCKLVYVTPEQLVKSGALNSILGRLHGRGMLARVVVDEVSTSFINDLTGIR